MFKRTSKKNTRDYKEFSPDTYYHIYNRGNGKQDIFLDSEDFNFFIFRLKENIFPDFARSVIINKKKKGAIPVRRQLLPNDAFGIVAYCLMPNHYHILIKQNKEISIAKLIAKTCTGYSKYFNKKYGRVGHLFQDKFRAKRIESDEYLLWLSAYIHNNPKSAKLVKKLDDYPWSSYLEYCGSVTHDICSKKNIVLDRYKNIKEYQNFVDDYSRLILEEKENIEDYFLD